MVWPPRKLEDFGELFQAEQKLREGVGSGLLIEVGKNVPPTENIPDAVLVRASFIRFLALGGCDNCRPHEKGLQIKGAFVFGDGPDGAVTKGIDLQNCELAVDIVLVDCLVPDKVNLIAARAKSVAMVGSFLRGGIQADRLATKGGFFLRESRIFGGASLPGANIVGDLDCSGATFEPTRNEQGEALDALSADGMTTGGAVFLKVKKASGTVRLVGARLGGYLDCSEAEFVALNDAKGTSGTALVIDALETKHGVTMDRSSFSGEVRMLGAVLGGDLTCKGASFTANQDKSGKPGTAFIVDGAKIGGKLYFLDVKKVEGIFSLSQVEVGSLCDSRESWPSAGNLVLNDFRYGTILMGPLDAKSRIEWLALQDAKRFESDFLPQPYEQCAKVLREMGHPADARAILIEKEKLQRKARRASIWKGGGELPRYAVLANIYNPVGRFWHLFWDTILNGTIKYGHQPLWAFGWLLDFWLIGAAVFAWAEGERDFKPGSVSILASKEWVGCSDGEYKKIKYRSQLDCYLSQPEAASYPPFNSFIYSADTLLPIISLGMEANWVPDDKQWAGWWAWWYLILHIILGWALSLLAVAGFSGLVKRD